MRQLKIFPEIILTIILVLLFVPVCKNDMSIKMEKEKIKYKTDAENTLENLDRKLVALRQDIQTLQEKEKAAVSEQIQSLEDVEDKLNRKYAEIDDVSNEEWPEVKAELDQLINKSEELIRKIESEDVTAQEG